MATFPISFSLLLFISGFGGRRCVGCFCSATFFTFVAQSTAYKIGHILLFRFSGMALLLFYSPSLFAWCFILNFLLHFSCLWINHVLFLEARPAGYSWRIHDLGFVSCFCRKRLLVWGSNLNWVISLSDKFRPRLCVSFPFFMSAGGLATHSSTQPLEIISSTVAPEVIFGSFGSSVESKLIFQFLIVLYYVSSYKLDFLWLMWQF